MTVRLFQPSFAGGELSPELYGRVDVAKYAVGLRKCRNFIVHRTGGVSNRAGFAFLGEVLDHTVRPTLIPFRFSATPDQVAILEFGDRTLRIWHKGGLILKNNVPLVLETPLTAAAINRAGHVQSGDILYFAHPDHPPFKLERRSWTDWRLSTVTFKPKMPPPKTPQVSVHGSVDKHTHTLSYKVTVVCEKTGEESLPSAAASVSGPTEDDWPQGSVVTLTVPRVPDAAYYRVYKNLNGLYGYIGLASKEGTFRDTNIAADVSDAPPDGRNPFASAGDYPSSVTLHQQRLCWANTKNNPNMVWMSRTGFFENMSVSRPTKDDDSLSFTLASGEINAISGLVSVNDLIILTEGSENICNGGATGKPLTPSSVTVKPQSYWGSGRLQPLVSGNTVLFAQGLGCAVRDLAYDYSVDGFTGNDRTILARHFLEGHAIVSWAYAQVPDSTFWMVRDDGALLSLAYFKEQDIGAWALHTTDGAFEHVAVVEGADRHEVYVTVRRTVKGRTVRFVERLAGRQDAAFLDSHQSYNGPKTRTISGLHYLEGKTVGVYADGTMLEDMTVRNGRLSLPRAHEHVVVGLRYDQDSAIETLDIDMGMVQGMGSVRGRKKTLSSVTVRLRDSGDFLAGPDADHMMPTKDVNRTYGQAPQLYTGDKTLAIPRGWNSTGRLVIRPRGAVPLTILGIAPDVTVGGDFGENR